MEEKKFCDKCGNELRDDDKFCSQCGATIKRNTNENAQIIETEVIQEDKKEELFCQKCGGPITRNDPYCKKCYSANPHYGIDGNQNTSEQVNNSFPASQTITLDNDVEARFERSIVFSLALSMVFTIIFTTIAPLEVIFLSLNYRKFRKFFVNNRTKYIRYTILNTVILVFTTVLAVYVIYMLATQSSTIS